MSLFLSRKGGISNRKNVQPIKEVASESACRYFCLQVALGGSDNSNIRPDHSNSSDALKFAFLEHSQQYHLGLRGKFSYFVEEDKSLARPVQSAKGGAASLR
jgi:hypothetical protein